MLLMATGTMDSGGVIGQGVRDSGDMNMTVAALLKKQKRTLVNFQEDFLIPFIYKAAWRFMQFAPDRYPSVDMKFIPTATLGIMAREYEQKQMAFMIQTLGADSPITPVLMKGVLKNSSLSNREEMMAQMDKMGQPDPQQQQMQQQIQMLNMKLLESQINESQAKANMNNALAQFETVRAQLHPDVVKSQIMAAISKNLPTDEPDQTAIEFDRRVRVAELMLKEKDIDSNKEITEMQMSQKRFEQQNDSAYLDSVKA